MAAAKPLRFPYEQKRVSLRRRRTEESLGAPARGRPRALARGQGRRSAAGRLARIPSRRLRRSDRAGAKLGARGANVASKSAAVAATYLEEDDGRAIKLLTEAAKRAEEAVKKAPDDANAWYLLAFVLGRYAQRVSILKALAEGVGGKVSKALERAVELEPKHADAYIALGLYHAEIIDKVGALAGRLTYGADAAKSVKHFEQALKLNPGSAIAHMEYANGLLMLHGDKQKKKAVELYRKAAAMKPPMRWNGSTSSRRKPSSSNSAGLRRATGPSALTAQRLELLLEARRDLVRVGHALVVRDQSELHLAGIREDAEPEADVARLRHPEDQPLDAPAGEVQRLLRARARWSRPQSPCVDSRSIAADSTAPGIMPSAAIGRASASAGRSP